MIDAMKAALKELEDVLDCINQDKIPFDGDDFHETLRTLRQAIEQAEKETTLQEMSDIGQEIKESTNSTKTVAKSDSGYGLQEPVAWIKRERHGVSFVPEGLINNPDKRDWISLYTAPVKREWVKLTDDDRIEIFNSMDGGLDGFLYTWGWLTFAKALEAKLQERNT